jgi:hypothetical protein
MPIIRVDLPFAKILGSEVRQVRAESGLPGGATHVLVTRQTRIGVTAETATEIETWMTQMRATLNATPEVQDRILRSERSDLAGEVRDAVQQGSDVITYHSNSPRAGQMIAAAQVKQAAAEEALRAFDAAHPEVLETIKAERAESAARHMWD